MRIRFREVERKLDQPREQQINSTEEGYRKIHSESNITTEECNNFWNKLFYSDDKSQEAIQRIAEETVNRK